MSVEKRKVSTDALETLGTIIESGGRDAIHLAVEPVVAGEALWPGQDIGISEGKAFGTSKGTLLLGIVDPFLPDQVQPGQKFWLVVYPRKITSLRHVWEHPDIPSEDQVEIAKKVADKMLGKTGSQLWIDKYASGVGFSYEQIIAGAENYLKDRDYMNTGDREEYLPDEFWDHYEKITGKKVASRGSFFSCSC